MAKLQASPNPSPTNTPVPVVAIGAAAGGVEAVSQLLTNLTPNTGFAFVYIQHADTEEPTDLPAVLSRVTSMPVLEAVQLMPVKANEVYIIPPDKDMEVVDGVLTLSMRRSRSHIQMPIDLFFSSLADRQQEGAIGILLSGKATDGTQGMKAIKAAGGITFAQDESAQFQNMPKSAVAERVVDKVLSPDEMAQELKRLSLRPEIFQPVGQIDELEKNLGTEEGLKTIFQYLRKTVNVDFSHYKMSTIRRRVIRRMLLYKLDTLEQYADYLKLHPTEGTALYQDLLINVTTFFRDEETMEYMQTTILPQLIKKKTARESIRIWVPACSTGQEAYSLAILLLETLGDRASNTHIQIFATDLSEAAIMKARLGIYSRSEVMDVAPRRLQRFFSKVDDRYRINKSIRDLCVFAPHNMLREPPFSRLDLVSCRNLLIYLDGTLQRKAIATFHYALNPNGYLLLGKSETIGTSTTLFAQVEKPFKVYVRKNDVVSRPIFDRSDMRNTGVADTEPFRVPAPGASASKNSQSPNDLEKVVDSLLLTQYVPASVVVNGELDILQFRGATGLFLEPAPGRASLNLLKMAGPSLVFELRNAVHKVRKSGQSYRKSGLEIKVTGKTHHVAIEAIPLKAGMEEELYLILFEEIVPVEVPESQLSEARNRRIKQLEEELATLREDMHSIIEEQEASNEELQSANEEIISSNEELQSINEELETSKEEIESTNEELLTINQELQVRNDQLSEAHEFAEAIFATIREATLVLDKDLRVRSANKAFYRLFRVTVDETEGHLLHELGNRQWDAPGLRENLDEILIHDANFQSFEITHVFPVIGEKVVRLNARKVVQQQRQEAILLAIEDITDQKKAQRLLEEREAWFHNIADNAPTLIWVASADGRVSYVNKLWLEYTGQTLDEIIARGWAQYIHPEDRDTYLNTYHGRFTEHQPFLSEYRLQRYDGQYHWMMENARPTFAPDGAFTGYIGTSTDIDLQKNLTTELDRRVQQRTRELEEVNRLLNQAQTIAHLGSFEQNLATAQWVISDEMYLIFGYEPRTIDFTGPFVDAHTHPDDIAPINARTEQAKRDCLPFSFIRRIYRPNGELRYLQNRHEVVCDETGKAIKVIGSVLDVTEQKLAEEKNQQSEQQLRTLLENTPDVITRWDQNLKLVYANDAFEAKTGLPNTALLGKTNQEMGQPAEIAEPYMNKLRKVFKLGVIQEHYNSFPVAGYSDQELLYYSLMVPEFGLDGSVQSVLAIARDITDLKKAEDTVKQTAESLQVVLDSSPAEIAFFKAVRQQNPESGQDEIVDFRVAVCNQRFAELKNKSASALLGQTTAELADILWDEKTLEYLRQVRLTGKPLYEERHLPDYKDGRWMAVSVTQHDDGVVVSGLDITALKQAEKQEVHWLEQLEQSKENLRMLDDLRQQIWERGEFLRSASHDLRSNFGVIQGAASLLDRLNTDEERAQMLEMIQRNVRQVTHQLTQLLDFSRLEAGQEQLEVSDFDAAALLNELTDSFKTPAGEKGLWLRSNGPVSLPVAGDPSKVRRIAQYLILNAVKHTKTGGITVSWRAEESGADWLLTVEDTGPGLSAKSLNSISGQASKDGGESDKAPGMSPGEGIELIIIKQLCQLIDAHIEVESGNGAGTVFQIRIPRQYDNKVV